MVSADKTVQEKNITYPSDDNRIKGALKKVGS
jgi:hypothetical protein